jgi:hypothetical protein
MIPIRVAADLLDGQITWSVRLQTATITTKEHIFLITVAGAEGRNAGSVDASAI